MVKNPVDKTGMHPGWLPKKCPGILAPSDTSVAESHYLSSPFRKISILIEFKIAGQDINSYAFHVCLK